MVNFYFKYLYFNEKLEFILINQCTVVTKSFELLLVSFRMLCHSNGSRVINELTVCGINNRGAVFHYGKCRVKWCQNYQRTYYFLPCVPEPVGFLPLVGSHMVTVLLLQLLAFYSLTTTTRAGCAVSS